MATEEQQTYKLPPAELWGILSKLSIVEDKPIMLDYWTASIEKPAKVLIGVKKATSEKLLVKNAEEYTSPISKIYNVHDCYILCTENSIYVVSSSIPTKYINS